MLTLICRIRIIPEYPQGMMIRRAIKETLIISKLPLLSIMMEARRSGAIFFRNASEFRSWLEKNHRKEKELYVGFYKIKTGKPSMTWSEAVDQALCFGWIDGVRHSIDEESYSNRFTPRRSGSNWSLVNVKKVNALKKAGLMTEEGLRAFEKRQDKKTGLYSFEKEPVKLSPGYLKQFQAKKVAWKFFSEQAPSYQRVILHWIMSAKLEETRQRRLNKIIELSSQRKRML